MATIQLEQRLREVTLTEVERYFLDKFRYYTQSLTAGTIQLSWTQHGNEGTVVLTHGQCGRVSNPLDNQSTNQ